MTRGASATGATSTPSLATGGRAPLDRAGAPFPTSPFLHGASAHRNRAQRGGIHPRGRSSSGKDAACRRASYATERKPGFESRSTGLTETKARTARTESGLSHAALASFPPHGTVPRSWVRLPARAFTEPSGRVSRPAVLPHERAPGVAPRGVGRSELAPGVPALRSLEGPRRRVRFPGAPPQDREGSEPPQRRPGAPRQYAGPLRT